MERFANLWFTMMDLNGDEEISVEEWMKFNSHFDIDRDHAAKSFDALDEDKDGTIDRMEFFRITTSNSGEVQMKIILLV